MLPRLLLVKESIDIFLATPSPFPKIIVIYGPTASGKTSLSIRRAQDQKSEVISADSRQIYRTMDIGTAKVTEEEKQGIPHHMIDICDPDESYSVGEWVRDAQEIISRIHQQDKIPIICWGTGLYIDALMYQFDIPEVPADESLRAQLEEFRLAHGNEALWKKLADIDPDYAHELHPNNHHYIIRAIEVFLVTGVSKKDLKVCKDKKYDVFLETPFTGQRKELYDRIDQRVDRMIEEGLLDEVKSILDKYEVWSTKYEDVVEKLPWLNTIGYKEVIEHFDGRYDRSRCRDLIAQHSRNYAKRQLTWFRNYTKKAS